MVVFAAGLAVAFGLNRFPIFESGLAGDADAAGLAAGETSAFLCPRVFAAEGEASGLAAGAGDVSAFLWLRFFAGEADASGLALGEIGLCAPTRETPARIIIDTSRARFVVMKRRLEVGGDFRQR